MVSAHNKEHDSFSRPDSTGRGPYAVIDLGSYTCRLLVVSRWEHCLETIEVFSRFTRLGEGISRSNLLSEEAIARTTQALVQCANRIQQHAPIAMRAVTTEAVRRAQNKDDFLNHIRKNTGISLEIISQEQEAKFALKGCAGLLDSSNPYGLVFDIGGGSTEITWILQKTGCAPEVLDWISLPFGVVTIAEDYYTDQANDYRLVRENTCNLLENFTERNNIRQYILENQVQILGTSGTATTALALHQGLKRYERTKIDGMMFKYPDIYKVIKIVQMMSTQERNYNRCIGIGRAELVLGGLAILEGLCNIWPVGVMKVADRGVREGIATDIAFGKDSPLVYEPYERLEVAA